MRMRMKSKGMQLSLTSGILAASASLFGKISMSEEICLNLYKYLVNLIAISDNLSFVLYPHSLIIILIRVLMFALMIISNALMWTQFTKALNYCSNSLQVMVINTSANFFITALYGQIFFKERLSYIWWIGSVFILFGLLLMRTSQKF